MPHSVRPNVTGKGRDTSYRYEINEILICHSSSSPTRFRKYVNDATNFKPLLKPRANSTVNCSLKINSTYTYSFIVFNRNTNLHPSIHIWCRRLTTANKRKRAANELFIHPQHTHGLHSIQVRSSVRDKSSLTKAYTTFPAIVFAGTGSQNKPGKRGPLTRTRGEF